ncbi:MAG: hypothetical protein RMX68_000915 [Aulosira sp. ZfuVER01]|nr:hypothetical protein [Aulosira sp. ZfuVER01]MDZ7998608.1 hypothetical protein [Aulosira sp. DedVER01a]MDZ8052047.1 hypothetical protein [Aulosira sp. ZfuCHP01]
MQYIIGWTRALKLNVTPKRKGYLWDGLLNSTVFISYVLEISFLLFMAAGDRS